MLSQAVLHRFFLSRDDHSQYFPGPGQAPPPPRVNHMAGLKRDSLSTKSRIQGALSPADLGCFATGRLFQGERAGSPLKQTFVGLGR